MDEQYSETTREYALPTYPEMVELMANLPVREESLNTLWSHLIEKYSPSAEQSEALAKTSPPPQSWYDEDVDPFSPEE